MPGQASTTRISYPPIVDGRTQKRTDTIITIDEEVNSITTTAAVVL